MSKNQTTSSQKTKPPSLAVCIGRVVVGFEISQIAPSAVQSIGLISRRQQHLLRSRIGRHGYVRAYPQNGLASGIRTGLGTYLLLQFGELLGLSRARKC